MSNDKMTYSLPSRIRKECARAEGCACRQIKDVDCDSLTILEIIKDGRNRDDVGYGYASLAAHNIYKYFLINNRYREARDAMYLACAMWLIPRNKVLSKVRYPLFYMPYLEQQDRNERLQQEKYPAELVSQPDRTWFDCLRVYPFVEDREVYRKILLEDLAAWQTAFARERQFDFLKTWDEGIAYSYPSYAHFVVMAIWFGQFEAIESSLGDFLKWAQWRMNGEKKASYQNLRSRGSRANQGEDPRRADYPPVKWETLLPLIDLWIKARKEPGPHEASGKKIMTYFYKWFVEEIYSDENSVERMMPMEVLFSIVMRIDLGVDLETCREFAKYFLPYLKPFDYIQEKLAALGVSYEEPNYMPISEIQKYYSPQR